MLPSNNSGTKAALGALSTFAISLGFATMAWSSGPEDIIRRYFEALNRHDRSAILKYYSTHYVVESVPEGFRLDKAGVESILDWDLGVNAKYEIEELEVQGDSVVVVFTETNEFLELVGLPPFRMRSRYIVEGSKIRSQEFSLLSGSVDIRPSLAPAVRWAKARYPEVLNEIYPESQLEYTAESAAKWLAILREWRSTLE